MRQRLLSLIPLIVCCLAACGALFYVSYKALFIGPDTAPPCPPLPSLAVEKESPSEETLTVEDGDTFASVLNHLGIPPSQSQEATEAISQVFNPKELRADQKICVTYQDSPNGGGSTLLSLSFQPEFDYEISLSLVKGVFEATKLKKHLTHGHTAIQGSIRTSLYAEALRAGASPKMLYEMIKAFSYDVDFQRDIQPGTEFCLFYETFKDEDMGLERPGELLYAKLVLEGKPYEIYHFQPKGGSPGYYSPQGAGIKKALLKTPIDGARLTSGFGNRRHPIKGYTKMHKGVDFAAPRGTPIVAAGDGVVERASRYGGYGNYVCIRHTGNTKTAYAHLNCYGKGIRQGTKVRQGQVIGYVGNTGLATGPHLHFELIQNGKHINPQKITQLPATKLGGKLLKDFQNFVDKIGRMVKDKILRGNEI